MLELILSILALLFALSVDITYMENLVLMLCTHKLAV